MGHAIDMNLIDTASGKFCNSKCLADVSKHPAGVKCFISKIRQNYVLRWGGDFSVPDVVHIDDRSLGVEKVVQVASDQLLKRTYIHTYTLLYSSPLGALPPYMNIKNKIKNYLQVKIQVIKTNYISIIQNTLWSLWIIKNILKNSLFKNAQAFRVLNFLS